MAKTRKAAAAAAMNICIATLTDICSNEDARDADRIAAAKLIMEMCAGSMAEEANELRVVLKDVPSEYLK